MMSITDKLEIIMKYNYKKILSFTLALIFVINICASFMKTDTILAANTKQEAVWPSCPDIYAKSAVLMDASTGTVIYDKNCHKKMYPASITKIMTALLTIENCKLDEEVTFSEKAITSLHYDDANFGCQIGEKMPVKDCLYTLMLASANEVATALAEHIAGSSEEFAKMMNERAKQAGAQNTHFVNANGLHDPNHYVTAYDMAMITKAASQYSLFNDIVNTTSYTVKKNNKRKESAISNQRHKMVWPTSGYYYDGIIGGKTGFTDQSGTTLVTYAKRNGMTLIAVVLHSNGTNVYKDTKALLDYGFNNFNLINVSENDKRFSQNDSHSLKSPFSKSNDLIYIDTASNIVIPKNTDFSKLQSKVDFNSSGDSFATITYTFGDKSVGTAGLMYESNVSKSTSPAKETSDSEKTVNNSVSSNNKKTNTTIKKKTHSFKLPGFLIPLLIISAIVIILIILTIIQQRRLNKIRAMKRRRRR